MAFEWTDKIDGVDDVLAEDINSIANEVKRIGSDEFTDEIVEKVINSLPIAEEAMISYV